MGAAASASFREDVEGGGGCHHHNGGNNTDLIYTAAKKMRERALVKYHLKHQKVLGEDALAKMEAMTQSDDGMARPEELCEILSTLDVQCTPNELRMFLERIGSLRQDGRYSWFELVSFLQPQGDREVSHGHFESTLMLLDWHMRAFCEKDGEAGQGQATNSELQPHEINSKPKVQTPTVIPLDEKNPRQHQCWGIQYLVVNSDFRDQEGKSLSKGRWAAQISHASVKATWNFRHKKVMPLYVEAADMKTIIYKTKKTEFGRVVQAVAGTGADYIIWQEQPEFQDAVLAIEPLLLSGAEASLAHDIKGVLKGFVALF